MTTRASRAKGVNFRGFLTALEKLRGPNAVAATTEQLTGELRDAVVFGRIVVGGWYPIAWYRALHEASQRALGEPQQLAWAIGHQAVKDDLRGIYRVFTRLLSPEWLFSNAPRVFNRYYELGRMEVTEAAPHRCAARFSACAGFNRNLWLDAAGACVATLEVCGAREVSLALGEDGAKDGDEHASMTATWK